jgi:minor fimbrial subunit
MVTFTGTAAEFPQTNMYMNTGTATNLAVNLISGWFGRDLANGSALIMPVEPDRTVTIPLIARAVTATGNVMPGSIIAVIQANITYN